MYDTTVIGIDLGATKVKAARVRGEEVQAISVQSVSAQGKVEVVMQEVITAIDNVWTREISGIGIGVPSVVDVKNGIVYDVQNIPSWKEVHIKDELEQHYNIPVAVNNDANCFALGEYYFGQGKQYDDMIGLILGTGLAAGIIINGRLYNGRNCGAGEVGMISYGEHHLEYYCSGQFFEHVHQMSGREAFIAAKNGDQRAVQMFEEYGGHLATAVAAVLFAYDPACIVLGGSVSGAYDYFKTSLESGLQSFPYRTVLDNLNILISENENVAVLGAAALYYDALHTQHAKMLTE